MSRLQNPAEVEAYMRDLNKKIATGEVPAYAKGRIKKALKGMGEAAPLQGQLDHLRQQIMIVSTINERQMDPSKKRSKLQELRNKRRKIEQEMNSKLGDIWGSTIG